MNKVYPNVYTIVGREADGEGGEAVDGFGLS
jgi:hypothetical protein